MNLDARMNRFRLAARELFNHFFFTGAQDEQAWAEEERFAEVRDLLFRVMVIEPAELPPVAYGRAQPDIHVILKQGDFAPWMLNREKDSGYWDHPLVEFTRETELQFMEFFDWDQVDIKDHRYVRVVVAAWPTHPELEGKQALVESQYVQFAKA